MVARPFSHEEPRWKTWDLDQVSLQALHGTSGKDENKRVIMALSLLVALVEASENHRTRRARWIDRSMRSSRRPKEFLNVKRDALANYIKLLWFDKPMSSNPDHPPCQPHTASGMHDILGAQPVFARRLKKLRILPHLPPVHPEPRFIWLSLICAPSSQRIFCNNCMAHSQCCFRTPNATPQPMTSMPSIYFPIHCLHACQ